MGTRNLTLVVMDCDLRMAQYGQFDGYPSGVGHDIAMVLEKTPLKQLKAAIAKCDLIPDDPDDDYSQWDPRPPLADRGISGGRALAKLLELAKTMTCIPMVDSSDFAGDSLFCEWAYLIDLDSKVVEVYQGFNTEPLTPDDTFYYLNHLKHKSGDKTFYPVRLYKTYPLKKFTPRAIEDLQAEYDKSVD